MVQPAAGGRAVAVGGDVGRAERRRAAVFDAVDAELGPLDALVANAGVVSPSARSTR